MDYEGLFSGHLPAPVDRPAGLQAQVKYVFSVTNADAQSMAAEDYVEALREAVRREGKDLGPYPPQQGHEGLRELIVQNLREKRGAEVDPEAVFLSAGAGGAITTLLDAFIDPGDVVLLEEFSYLGTLGMLLERRAQAVHVPTDSDGMDTGALEAILKSLAAEGRRPKLIYTIAVYQNPMGMTLSLERRRRMVELSQEYGVPILENESYADFRIDGDPLPPAMMGMDGHDSVMYVSSFTKLLGCGLRLGFGVAPAPVREVLQRLRFGGRPSHLAAMAVHEFMRDHQAEHIENVRRSLQVKRDAMLAALRESFPAGCEWSTPHGGMMVWVRLPEGADTWKALDRAVEADVKYNPGGVFRADRDCNNYLRLTFSHNSAEEIREGVAILAGVFRREGLFAG